MHKEDKLRKATEEVQDELVDDYLVGLPLCAFFFALLFLKFGLASAV